MYSKFDQYTTVTKRRGVLADFARRGLIKIESIESYEQMPEIRPLEGREIHFFEDGIEAETNVIRDGHNIVGLCAVLIDEKRYQVIKFSYPAERDP